MCIFFHLLNLEKMERMVSVVLHRQWTENLILVVYFFNFTSSLNNPSFTKFWDKIFPLITSSRHFRYKTEEIYKKRNGNLCFCNWIQFSLLVFYLHLGIKTLWANGNHSVGFSLFILFLHFCTVKTLFAVLHSLW